MASQSNSSPSTVGISVDVALLPGPSPKSARRRKDAQKLPDLLPGALIQHYELIRKVGSGGAGLVFLARDVRLGRLVALKILLVESRVAVDRFLAEARATASCRHENIVLIYDVGEIACFPYLVLEYVQGRTLREWMREEVLNRVTMAIEIILPVTRALARAHDMGIIHRDLKPENILISDTGQVKVVDFGIAKQFGALQIPTSDTSAFSHSNHPITEDGAIVGTANYMSPEQWLGEPLDARTDIWALGLVLFELATGVHPLELLIKTGCADVSVLDIPMPSARDLMPEHPELAAIIDKCLMKRVEDRHGDAVALVEALEQWLRQEKQAGEKLEHLNPFAGLAAFQESDAARFFGRDDDVAAVVARLRNQPLVAIAGPSGAGKSSFVRAGVIPALKRSYCHVEVFVVRPGPRPLTALADLLISLGITESSVEPLTELLRMQPGFLGATLRARCKQNGNDHRIVLFLDQFEELFTQGIDASERAALGACLEGVADDASSPLRVILTIRSDFLDRVAEERQHLFAISRGLVFLPPMTKEGLRQALEKPIDGAGYRFEEPELVTEMLESLTGLKTPLPLLQFIGTKWWEARDRERHVLTRNAYGALGGIAGALSTHADAVLAAMTPLEQRLVQRLFLRLVTPERTRAVLHWDELLTMTEDPTIVEQVLHQLNDARLLLIATGDEPQRKTVELIHESLIEGWATLQQWLHANETDVKFLADVRNAARQWESNEKADDFLWRDRAAVRAQEWFAQLRENAQGKKSLELGAREVDFLESVVRLADRTKRRRKQWVGGAMAALCAVVFVVSFLGLQAGSEARRADAKANEAAQKAEEAKRSAAEARNATRMAAANARRSNATLALAWLRELEPTVALPPKWSELAQWIMYQDVARAVITLDAPASWAAFSPDGRHIVTTSWDQKARVWNADGQGEPLVFEGHTDQIQQAVFSFDGTRIVTASADKTARIWNTDGSGKTIVFAGHQGPVTSAVFSPDGLRVATGSSDKTVRIWNADGSDQPLVLEGHQEAVTGVAFSPDGQRIASSSDDGTVRVWDVNGQDEPIVLRGHRDHVQSVAFSPDGQRIVSASFDNSARVWNADGSGEPVVLARHNSPVRTASFSPDGKSIVTASWDHSVRVWRADGQGEPRLITGHEDKLSSAEFSPDGQTIVTASLDKTVRIWSVDNTDSSQRLEGHEGTIISATFSPDGTRVVTASFDKTARIWKVNDSEAPIVLRGHEGKIMSAAFSPDGNRVITASQDKTIRIWDAHTGTEKLVLRDHHQAPLSAVFSPDGRFLTAASWDHKVRVWNADGRGDPLVLAGHQELINSATFSPDGLRIASASEDKTVRIWTSDGSGERRVLRGHTAGVYSVAFSPDGRHVLTASWDKTVQLWNLEGHDKPLVFPHNAAVGSGSVGGMGAFSPDGTRFVTIADDRTVHLWNSNGSGEPVVLHFPTLYPTIAAFSPDGSRIVTASHEGKNNETGATRYWATLWPAFASLVGPNDARLWRATTYCPPVSLRRELLGVSEALAQEQFASCQFRVAGASNRTAD